MALPRSPRLMYRLELVRGNTVLDSFNFATSLQSIGYDGKYRDAIYKTFGGTKLDIQGMDNTIIKIAGTFAGRRKRMGWGRFAGMLDNYGALKYLRDNIWKYPENPKYKGVWDKLQVRFYDIDLKESQFVHINNVSFSRAKDKPFWVDFSVGLTTMPKLSSVPTDRLAKALQKYKDWLGGKVNTVQMYMEMVQGGLDTVRSVTDTVLGFSDATVGAISSVTASVEGAFNSLITLPGDLTSRMTDTIETFRDAGDQLGFIVANDIGLLTEYGPYMTSLLLDLQQSLVLTGEAWTKAVSKENLKSIYNKTTLLGTKGDSSSGSSGGSDIPGGSGSSASYDAGNGSAFNDDEGGATTENEPTAPPTDLTGFVPESTEVVTLTGDTTLTQFAIQTYGDETMVPVLMELNGLDTVFLPAGTELVVPKYSTTPVISDNLVISSTPDLLGTDVALDLTGELVASSSGDLSTVSGVENVTNVINNIYRQDEGNLLSDPSFGFSKEETIGNAGTEELASLLEVKLRDTLLQDPRIRSVEDMTFAYSKDIIRVGGRLVLENGQSAPVSLTL